MVEKGRHYKTYLFSLLLKSLATRAEAQFQACPSKQSIYALRVKTRHSTFAQSPKRLIMIRQLPMIVANDCSVHFITFFTFCGSQEAPLLILVNRAKYFSR